MAQIKTQKLGAADVAWLRMESPTNPMTIVGLLAFAEPMGIDELKGLLAERLLAFDRFRQKLDLRGGAPTWSTDPDFDLDAHVHRAGLPSPGDKATLEGYVGELMSTPLDLSKPPWQFHLVEDYGLADGTRGAVWIARLHHTIGDGIALIHVLLSLADEHFATLNRSKIPDYGRPRSGGSLLGRLTKPLGKAVGGLGGAALGAVSGALGAVQEPAKVLDWAKTGMSVGAAASRIALLPSDSETRFKGAAGVTKRVAWSEPLSLEAVKTIGRVAGAKVNDVLLAAVAGGLRRFFEGEGDPVDGVEFATVIPVNLRPASEAFELGNQFGIVFLFLPVGVADQAERLREVTRRMEQIKASAEPAVAFGILQTIGAGPEWLHEQVVDILSARCSAVMTNVPGPQQPLHMLGKRASHLMFWVPRAGDIGLGLSVISYAGTVRLGVATDARMAPDPAALVRGFHAEFEAMEAAFAEGTKRSGRKRNP